MGFGDTVTELGATVKDLYTEIVTTSVRFDALQASTREWMQRMERTIDALVQKLDQMHEQHVREIAALEGRLEALAGRITALSEQALHAVARDVAGDLLRGRIAAAGEEP